MFLYAHLQVVYYKCVKFHKNPISGLGGVALTRYMDGRTDAQGDSYIPPNFVCGSITSMLDIYDLLLPNLPVYMSYRTCLYI